MPDQINASGAPAIPGSAGSVPADTNPAGQTNPGVDYEKQYKELEQRFGQMGAELGEYREFVQNMAPVLTELNANPELVQAIIDKKIDPELAKAVQDGRVTIAEAAAATAAHAEVQSQLGSEYKAASPEEIAKLVDEKLSSKLREIEEKNEFSSFERKTAEFIEKTSDFADYADQVDQWIDAHPNITDIEVAYYAVKGQLSESAAKKAADEAQAEAAKQAMLNAQGGGVHATQIPNGDALIDSLIQGSRNPNIF